MASELRVNTLKDASGNNSIATSFVAGGSAKCWGHVTQGTTALDDSFNCSSISDDATGRFTITRTTSMGNDDYCITVGVSETTATDGATNRYPSIDGDGSTSDCRFGATYGGSNYDVDEVYVKISGDLS